MYNVYKICIKCQKKDALTKKGIVSLISKVLHLYIGGYFF